MRQLPNPDKSRTDLQTTRLCRSALRLCRHVSSGTASLEPAIRTRLHSVQRLFLVFQNRRTFSVSSAEIASLNVAETAECGIFCTEPDSFRKIEKIWLYDRSFVFKFREHLFLLSQIALVALTPAHSQRTNFVSHRFSRQTNEFNYRIKTKFMHDRSDCERSDKTNTTENLKSRTLDPDVKGHVAEGFCVTAPDDRSRGLQTKTRTYGRSVDAETAVAIVSGNGCRVLLRSPVQGRLCEIAHCDNSGLRIEAAGSLIAFERGHPLCRLDVRGNASVTTVRASLTIGIGDGIGRIPRSGHPVTNLDPGGRLPGRNKPFARRSLRTDHSQDADCAHAISAMRKRRNLNNAANIPATLSEIGQGLQRAIAGSAEI